MKRYKYILLCFTALTIVYSCKKNQQTDYKDFLQGHEVVYTGAVKQVITEPGNLEMGLKWKVGSDPNITKYVVYYNNGVDSQTVDAATVKNDTIRTVIKGLQEYTYSFTVYSFDTKGDKSLPLEINNAKVYGPIYKLGLVNRPYNANKPFSNNTDGSFSIYFGTPDTINIKTVVTYTNKKGATAKKVLLAKDTAITFKDIDLNSPITYLSYYIPERNAIDTFAVATASVFPAIRPVLCDKSLFKAIVLPNDIPGTPGMEIEHLWDGSVGAQAPPNVYFSDGSKVSNDNPNHFTFDLGKTYTNLGRVEETGTTIGPLNPSEFEVWGIADITNAATTLPSNDPGWAAESKAKGWVLLKDCARNDDGTAPMQFDLTPNPPPVRYIRIRIIKSALAPNSFGLSELSFWNLQ